MQPHLAEFVDGAGYFRLPENKGGPILRIRNSRPTFVVQFIARLVPTVSALA
jgi:hypothetical protein